MAQPRKKTEQEKQRQQREVENRQAPNFASLYANNIYVRATPWDIQLTFGEILSADETKMVIENRLAVNLSPQTAKSLLKTLMGVIQQYEGQIGEIKYGEAQEQPQA